MKKKIFLLILIFIVDILVLLIKNGDLVEIKNYVVNSAEFLIKNKNLVKHYVKHYIINSYKYKKGYVPGEIILWFTDDAPYSEITQVVESENLTFEKLYKAFEPEAFVFIPEGQAKTLSDKLKQNRLVAEVIPEVNGKMRIKFVFGTTKKEAEEVLKQVGLIMTEFYRFAYIKVKTPKVKEQFYIDKFRKLPIIKSAELNYVGHIYIH